MEGPTTLPSSSLGRSSLEKLHWSFALAYGRRYAIRSGSWRSLFKSLHRGSVSALCAEHSSLLVKLCVHERGDGRECLGGLAAMGADVDCRAGARGEHHEAHDRRAADRLAVLGHLDFRIEFFNELDELG